MPRNKHIRDGNNAQVIPDGVTLQLGEYPTLPTCNISRKNQVAIQGGVPYFCNGTAWSAIDIDDTVDVRKNSTGSVFSRKRLNFIEGSSVTLTVADDSPNNEVDITVSVSAGAGLGDFSSNTATSVANELVLFADTTGKLGKRATTTGIVKATSGVIGAATAGTDYYNPGGTDVAVADGGTGASTAATARANLVAAPAAAKYIVQTADSELSAEQALGALATGVLKSTTTTGVLSIAVPGTDFETAGTSATHAALTGTAVHGLGTMSTQGASAVAITGGSVTGITDITVADGGTGSSTASGARTNLGLVIGTDVQAQDADLTTLSTAFTSASASGPASLALAEDTDNGSNTVTLQAPASVASDRTILLPDASTYLGHSTSSAYVDLDTVFTTFSAYITDLYTNKQPLDADLTTIAGLTATTNNIIQSVGSAWASRTPTQVKTALGLTVGSDVQAYDPDLGAIAALSGTGLIAHTGAGAALERTITGTANKITVTNGDGVSGNPTLTIPTGVVLVTPAISDFSNSVHDHSNAAGGGTFPLNNLSDATISSPTTNQYFKYNGVDWVNADFPVGTITVTNSAWTYSSQWGSAGSSNGQFTGPIQIAYDSTGNIYVADFGNNRIQKFNSAGTWISNIISASEARGICLDSSNNIYVTFKNAVNDYRLAKYNSSGVLQWTSVTLTTFSSIALGHCATDGASVFVTLPTDNTIKKLSCSTGAVSATYGSAGTGNGQFNAPYGIATDNTYLYITDNGNDRVQKLNLSGTYITQWGSTGTGNGRFISPLAVAVNASNNNILVTDTTRSDIQVFTNTGAFLQKFGGPGTGNGQFGSPFGIAVTSAGTSVHVSDSGSQRIQKFTEVTNSVIVPTIRFDSNAYTVVESPTGVATVSPIYSGAAVTDAEFIVTDDVDVTKGVRLEVSNVTPATIRTWTALDASGVVVLDTATQTLSGKTLTTPTISSTGFTNANHAHDAANSGGVLGMASQGIIRIHQTADYTGSNVNTAQKIFNTSTNGAATVAGSTTYEMKAVYHIHTTGTTSHDLRVLFGGTATLTSIGYSVISALAAPATELFAATSINWFTVATASAVSNATAAATHHTVVIEGQVVINAGGTFVPQYQWSAAPGVAGVTLANSWFRLTPVSSATLGTWT